MSLNGTPKVMPEIMTSGIYFALYSDRNPHSIIEVGWLVDYKLVCLLYKQIPNIDKGFNF